MPFNGSGVFQRVRNWVADATAGVKIRADYHDNEDDGFASGLSNCITKDGQTTVTQNIPFNNKRVTGLADPINAQDAATKAYADTKVSTAGGSTMTGDLTVEKDNPTIVLDKATGVNSIQGQNADKLRWNMRLGNDVAESGSNAGSNFDLHRYADDGSDLGEVLNFDRATGLGVVLGNPTTATGIATKGYVDAGVNARLPLAGGTVTGSLTVNGELVATANYLRFGASAGPGYIIWSGGANYSLGGGGTIWHSGNFNPGAAVTNARLVHAGDFGLGYNSTWFEAASGIITGLYSQAVGPGGYPGIMLARCRYLQVFTTSWWTVGFA